MRDGVKVVGRRETKRNATMLPSIDASTTAETAMSRLISSLLFAG